MSTAEALSSGGAEQLSDEEVVRRVLGGDTALFEIILRRYNQRIYRAIRAIVRREEEIEDAMQQAYVSAYEHLHQFADRARFSTWLTRIAINEALARVRKRNHTLVTIGENDAVEEIESREPDPEQQAVASQLREVTEREVAALGESYRAVFILREVEGLSTEETAECLSVSEDVVKTRLHRARAMLRDNLYRRAGVTLQTLFTFGNARCDRVVAAVLARLSASSE
jgi:RNA polymerase sigma-70 factor (ECF subfamily)